jgi:adenosylcobinamide-phosphate guanylyltransferase
VKLRVAALIMAGGKSQRFGKNVEKPTVKLNGKSFIQRVIEAAKESKKVSEVYVAVTKFNPKTADAAEKISAKVITTEGKGYHSDLQQAIKEAKLNGPVLVISSDLPLLSGKFLDKAISRYEEIGKSALVVLVPVEACYKYGINPTSFYEHKGKEYAVSGINIIDGQQIIKGQPLTEEQPQETFISTRPEALFNINTSSDLKAAKRYLQSKKRTRSQKLRAHRRETTS